MSSISRNFNQSMLNSTVNEQDVRKNLRGMSSVQVRDLKDHMEAKGTMIAVQANNELRQRKRKHEMSKIDKMFDLPLMMSICMLAMAHGSNEINVAAPLTAEIFLLDSGDL